MGLHLTHSTLLTVPSDPAVKQIILNLNDKKRFIIQDLDLQHILVSPDSVQTIKFEVEKEVGSAYRVHTTAATAHTICSLNATLSRLLTNIFLYLCLLYTYDDQQSGHFEPWYQNQSWELYSADRQIPQCR